MAYDEKSVTVQVRRGIRVNVEEVDTLEGDRELVAQAPAGLKVAITQVAGTDLRGAGSPAKITMCG
jgi:hypothetical protein